jgi:hypothetical protein
MESIVAVLGVVTVIAAGTWFQYRLSRGRMWTPLWLAFSATATSILFIVAGTLGVNLSKQSRFLAGDASSHGVVWWEVGVGVAVAIASVFLWRQGVRSLQTGSVVNSTTRRS